MIDIQDFSKSFGEFQAVSDLSMEVKTGEIFGFLGRNGAGKTTTIRSLLRIYQPDQGTLKIEGQEFNENMKEFIGYLPEERGLYTRSTVWDTVLYFARLKGLDRNRSKTRAEEEIRRFQLWEHREKKIQNLSSGMQQKVQIIQSIIHSPRLLILDEPFRGLDPINRQIVFDTLLELKERGVTIMFSSHQITEIEDICDRIIMIAEGRKKAYGSINEVKSQFEPHFIHLNFEGELPEFEGIEWVKNQGNQAEIKFLPETDPNQILRQCLDHGVCLEKFEVSRPSLNEIFIDLCADSEPSSTLQASNEKEGASE